jgi:hypothetical protein
MALHKLNTARMNTYPEPLEPLFVLDARVPTIQSMKTGPLNIIIELLLIKTCLFKCITLY